MLHEYLKIENISIGVDAKTPVEAITAAGQLLVDSNYIKKGYIDEMIEVYQRLGAYIVIAPRIAFPHSKPSKNVLKTSVSFCKLKEPIKFNHPQNDPVEFVFALGGVNETDHIEMLRGLSTFLMDKENVKELEKVKDRESVIRLLQKGGM